MAKNALKILLGLALLPFCLGFTWQLAATVFAVRYRPDTPYFFLAGGFAYLAVHLLFRKPILSYVVAHELTHALFAVLFGGSIKSFHADERGGRVTLTKSNFVITLAPYFFPLYTCIALLFYWIGRAAEMRNTAANAIIFLSGATFTFHVVLTLVFLQTDQNDIQEQGALFSYPLIYLFNVVFAAFLLYLLLAADMNFARFLAGGTTKGLHMVLLAYNKFHALAQTLPAR
jgi:Peptidase M50B-like